MHANGITFFITFLLLTLTITGILAVATPSYHSTHTKTVGPHNAVSLGFDKNDLDDELINSQQRQNRHIPQKSFPPFNKFSKPTKTPNPTQYKPYTPSDEVIKMIQSYPHWPVIPQGEEEEQGEEVEGEAKMSPQQDSQTQFLAMKVLPTSLGTLRTIYHGRIRCESPPDTGGAPIKICQEGLSIRIRWPGYTTSRFKSGLFQAFAPGRKMLSSTEFGEQSRNVLWIPVFQTSVEKQSFGMEMMSGDDSIDPKDPIDPTDSLTELYIMGEIEWAEDSLPDQKFIVTFELADNAAFRGTASATIPPISKLTLAANSSFISYLGAHSQYNGASVVDITFQYWLQNVPFPYSGVFIQQFGWAVPLLGLDSRTSYPEEEDSDFPLYCSLNGISPVRLKLIYSHSVGNVPLLLGFTLQALDPQTQRPLSFPKATDLTIQCGGFSPTSQLSTDQPTSGLGIQVQVFEKDRNFTSINYDTLEPQSTHWYAEIINRPSTRSDSSKIDRFGFFAIDENNTPLYQVQPTRPMTWTGSTKQPLTNGAKCISQYSRRFNITFLVEAKAFETDVDIPAIPVQLFLEATDDAKLITGRWNVIWYDFQAGIVDLIDSGPLAVDDTHLSNHLVFKELKINGICYQPVERGVFEILFTVVLECREVSQLSPSSFVVVYDQLNVRSVDSYGTKFRTVHASSYSQLQLLNTTQIMYTLHRVNLTNADPVMAEMDLLGWQYRYSFNITVSHLPSLVPLPQNSQTHHQSQPSPQQEFNSFPFDRTDDGEIINNEIGVVAAIPPTQHLLRRTVKDSNGVIRTQFDRHHYDYPPHHDLDFKKQHQQHHQKQHHPHHHQQQPQQEPTPLQSQQSQPSQYSAQPEAAPFQWAEFTFLSEMFVYTGNFSQCFINGKHINPVMVGEDGISDVPPGTILDSLAFQYTWALSPNELQDMRMKTPTYNIYCNDVFLVNVTAIEFQDTPHPDRTSWYWPADSPIAPTNPLGFQDPIPSGVQVFFSHFVSPSQAYYWSVVGGLAEFDPVKHDLFYLPSMVLTILMTTCSVILVGIWVYSGTQHAANNAVHRSARTKLLQQQSQRTGSRVSNNNNPSSESSSAPYHRI